MPKAAASRPRPNSSYAIHSVEKALDLLEAICDEGGEVRITELSQRLGLKKTNVFRLLATFEQRGFVERGDDAVKYRLGLSAYEMGQKLLSRMGLLRKARPAMERLARQSDEAVYFLVPRNDEVLMLDMIDSPHQVKVMSLVGRRFTLASSAVGQVFRAFARYGGSRLLATRESTSGDERLARIRQCGYCQDQDGLDDGVTLLSTPLFNVSGQVVAALAILGPTFRMPRERIDNELAPHLLDAGRIASTNLGYLSDYLQGSFS